MTVLREPPPSADDARVGVAAGPTAPLLGVAPTIAHVDDADALASAVASGDVAAFGRLYDAIAPRVHGMLLALLSPADAERVTGEVLVAAWAAAPRLVREGRSIERWARCHALLAADAQTALGTAA